VRHGLLGRHERLFPGSSRSGRLAAPTTRAALVGATVLAAVALCGCESTAQRAAGHALQQAADTSVCQAAAKPADVSSSAFPSSFPMPPRTTVYHVEDRGADGTIVTAISSLPFQKILGFMNHDVVTAGFRHVSGETEEHDAEANWVGNGYQGRWAIRVSGSCNGQAVIQVLSAHS
jgi:hypothetical protein